MTTEEQLQKLREKEMKKEIMELRAQAWVDLVRRYNSNREYIPLPDRAHFFAGFDACIKHLAHFINALADIIEKQSDLIEDVYSLSDDVEHYFLTQCVPTKDEADKAEKAKKRAQSLEEKINGILGGKETQNDKS